MTCESRMNLRWEVFYLTTCCQALSLEPPSARSTPGNHCRAFRALYTGVVFKAGCSGQESEEPKPQLLIVRSATDMTQHGVYTQAVGPVRSQAS